MRAEAAVESITTQVRDAQAARRPLRIVGAGTWRHAFSPDAAETIDTGTLTGIVEYVPGDLTITARAGTTLAEIERETASHGQWLTLDPFGSSDGTIGATISTASSGPLATGLGTPRDILLGVTVVTGNGATVNAGGRVVKNVAGFDLPRLFTGSRGTLGVITQVTLRLRGRPADDETVAITVNEKPAALKPVLNALRALPLAPMAAELLSPVGAGHLGLEAATTMLLRFGGNARAVAAAKKKAAALGKLVAVDAAIWSRYRASDHEFESVLRINDLPSAFVDRWSAAAGMFGSNCMVSGSPLRGVVRCAANGIAREAVASLRSAARGASLAFDSLPDSAAWNAFSAVPDSASLHGRVRAAFDPVGIMNPGAMRLAR
jgi:FAD/FMN-containing dehydrogenase